MKTLRPALAFLLLFWGCAHFPKPAREGRPERQHLVIALDGVPFGLMQELKSEGHFPEFKPPTKVISTFPSTTTSAFGAMFHEVGGDRPPGYDREYFSRDKKKIQGFLSSIHPKSPTDFRNLFDYYRHSPFQKFWIYATPGFAGHRDLDKIRNMIWKQPQRETYVAYIGATDGAGHVLGRRRVRHWLIYMETALDKLRGDYERDFGRELEITLFSDHGFHYFRKPNAVSKMTLVHRLRKVGLSLSNNLIKPDHAVFMEWGNISGGSVYVDPACVEQVAEILAGIHGVDLVAYRQGDNIRLIRSVVSRGEAALIDCREGSKRCRYRALSGDPLAYEPVLERLRRKGRLDRGGYASPEDWLAETSDHYYPDALFRLHDAFYALVTNPASILFSTDPNYEYGDVRTRMGAWFHGGLKGTHGGLFQEASAAFVMTTDSLLNLPGVLRYNQLLPRILRSRSIQPAR